MEKTVVAHKVSLDSFHHLPGDGAVDSVSGQASELWRIADSVVRRLQRDEGKCDSRRRAATLLTASLDATAIIVAFTTKDSHEDVIAQDRDHF